MFTRFFQARKTTFFLREMGVILLLGTTFHFVAVTYLYLSQGFPSHDRIGYIYFIGLLQIAVGLLDIRAARLVPTDRSSARSIAVVSAIVITGYAMIIFPVYPDFSFLFKLAPPAY